MKITVAYALPERQRIIEIDMPEHSTAEEAIQASNILSEFPGVSIEHVGIFGKPVSLNTELSAGDRVEIYRPLMKDPKEARRERGQQKDR